MPGDESPVPADDGRWLHDQEHLIQALAIEHPRQDREDRPISLGEPRSRDPALQDEDLVAESEDLGVTVVAGSEQPRNPGQHQAKETTNQKHQPRVRPDAEPQRNQHRMSF